MAEERGPLRPIRKVRLARWPSEDFEYVHWLYRSIKTNFEWPVLKLTKARWKGLEHVPMEGGVVLAPNHYTYADPILVSGVLPRPVFYFANETLFKNPVARSFFLANGQIMVDRTQPGANEAALQRAVDLLQSGFAVGIFPEGSRTREGLLQRGKTGAARVAMRAEVPVVPMAMTTAELWPKGRTMPRFRDPVYINIGKPMMLPGGPERADDRDAARAATDAIMAEIRRLLEEALKARESGEPWDSK